MHSLTSVIFAGLVVTSIWDIVASESVGKTEAARESEDRRPLSWRYCDTEPREGSCFPRWKSDCDLRKNRARMDFLENFSLEAHYFYAESEYDWNLETAKTIVCKEEFDKREQQRQGLWKEPTKLVPKSWQDCLSRKRLRLMDFSEDSDLLSLVPLEQRSNNMALCHAYFRRQKASVLSMLHSDDSSSSSSSLSAENSQHTRGHQDMDGVHSSKRRPLPVNHADRNGSILIIGLCVVIFITVVFILFKKTKTGERHIAEYLHARREVAEDQDRANRRSAPAPATTVQLEPIPTAVNIEFSNPLQQLRREEDNPPPTYEEVIASSASAAALTYQASSAPPPAYPTSPSSPASCTSTASCSSTAVSPTYPSSQSSAVSQDSLGSPTTSTSQAPTASVASPTSTVTSASSEANHSHSV